MSGKFENGPNLERQKKILEDHPHVSKASHGTIRKMKPWHPHAPHRKAEKEL